ncbi:MAG: hypothetical protein GY742_01735 [Hyphomicrobiales bacterium]|nr:hypothetical protein [Hyphomicrobiales bacterium]
MRIEFTTMAIGIATLLATAPVVQAQNTIVAAATPVKSEAAAAKQPTDAPSTIFNMFGSSMWTDAAGDVKPGEMIEFDPADPRSWAKAIDPNTHSRVHMTVTNPQFYAKFMTPVYYMKFMEPGTWLSYVDPSTYEPLMKVVTDTKTITHWMQPATYMHEMNPRPFLQMANPDAYTKLASAIAEGYGTDTTKSAANMFNPFSWMKQFADAATTPAGEVKKTR